MNSFWKLLVLKAPMGKLFRVPKDPQGPYQSLRIPGVPLVPVLGIPRVPMVPFLESLGSSLPPPSKRLPRYLKMHKIKGDLPMTTPVSLFENLCKLLLPE